MLHPRLLGLAGILLLASLANAQAAPKDSAVVVSPEEYQRRLEKLHRKATQPSDPETPEQIAAKRQLIGQKLANDRALAQQGAPLVAAQVEIINATEEAVKPINAELAELQLSGRAAEQNLSRIMDAYNLQAMEAQHAGTSSFEGGSSGSFQGTTFSEGSTGTFSGTTNSTFGGTIYDPSKRLAAIMAVEARYGPDLAAARQQVGQLFQRQSVLVAKRAQLGAKHDNAWRERIRLIKKYGWAAASTRAQPQNAAAQNPDAAWSQFATQYPGVDVKAVWSGCVADAKKALGNDNPRQVEWASALFHERCAAASKAAQSAPTEPPPPRDLLENQP